MDLYKSTGPFDAAAKIDAGNVKGKTVIITGGASGIGQQYTRILVENGAHVVIADISEEAGSKLHHELKDSTTFVRCDVTKWTEQKAAFRKAIEVSPKGRIDVVVANAGTGGNDGIFMNDVEAEEPDEPALNTLAVHATGSLLTVKLALWYFRKQFAKQPEESRDQCLVLQASIAAYTNLVGVPQYTFSKFGLRGLLVMLRTSEQMYGIRVNLIAPWYVRTGILLPAFVAAIEGSGTKWARIEDAATAMLRIVSDRKVNGRALGILPREWKESPNGYVDLSEDDFGEDTLMGKLNSVVNAPMQWMLNKGREIAAE